MSEGLGAPGHRDPIEDEAVELGAKMNDLSLRKRSFHHENGDAYSFNRELYSEVVFPYNKKPPPKEVIR